MNGDNYLDELDRDRRWTVMNKVISLLSEIKSDLEKGEDVKEYQIESIRVKLEGIK